MHLARLNLGRLGLRKILSAGINFAVAVFILSSGQPSFADCGAPFPAASIGEINKPQIEGSGRIEAQVQLALAGTYARKEFGQDFLAKLNADLAISNHQRGDLFDGVTIAEVADLAGYVKQTKPVPGPHQIVLILDSEFMIGDIPKYNGILSTFRFHRFRPDEIMIIDPFPPTWNQPAIVQINDEVGAQNAIYLIEIALSLLILPDLTSSEDFHRYEMLAMSEIGPGQDVSDQFLQMRKRLILDCIVGDTTAN